MKKTLIYLTFLIALIANNLTLFGQAGYIHTVAGGGTSTANGVPATSAALDWPDGMGVDAAGNLYFVDFGAYRIRKVDAYTGLIYTVAGNGASGFSGDGGPATDARFSDIENIFVDLTGNIYIADKFNNRIRKVDAATGYIYTVAGGGAVIADGIPATSANLGVQPYVYVDVGGNIYCSGIVSSGAVCVKKISSATGIATTVAGGGTSAGEGIMATGAYLYSVNDACVDGYGNMYILQNNNQIRKIDGITGIIHTIIYAVSTTSSSSAFAGVHGFKTDAIGNLYIADWTTYTIKRIDASTGLISIIAGGGTSLAEGAEALSALVHPYQVCLDPLHGIIYYSDLNEKVRKFTYPPLTGGSSFLTAGSFSVKINRLCNGPELSVIASTYVAGLGIKTNFGDGTADSIGILSGAITNGYAIVRHAYQSVGTYIIKQVLFDGPVRVDSISYAYNYTTFCRSLPVKLYFDENGNCIKDASEHYSTIPFLIRVDSNGVNVKTISATSGFWYNAYSLPGDIYQFRFISPGGGISPTCPASGIISDTVFSSVTTYPDKYFGFSCNASYTFDNSVHAVVSGSGVHQQDGDIYVYNTSCLVTDAMVTLHYSKKYQVSGLGIIYPPPVAYSDSTVIWNLAGLSASTATQVGLHYRLSNNPVTGYLSIGDTVHSYYTVTPVSGDSNPSNNSETRIDTVKAGYDPNEIFVSPANCLAVGSAPDALQYTIHFENTGNDTAHDIYVMDTLSANIDPSSIRIITASATMNIQMLKDYGYNIIRFDFPKINLLDSSHHGLCDGAVIFSARTWPGLAYGTQIYNRAGIYFDINPVVMTNTVQNTKGCWAAGIETISKQQNAILYPNPATDELTIKAMQAIYTSFTITNSMGQIVMQQDVSNSQIKVNVNALSPGLYFVTLRSIGGNEVQKFIKW